MFTRGLFSMEIYALIKIKVCREVPSEVAERL